jgi:aurora kinase
MKDKKTNMLYAVKAIHKELIKEEEITEQFIRELKIQSYLNHQNLIKTYRYFCDKTFIYIIMEPALGGQLHSQYTFPIHENKASHLLKQICNGLHRHHMIH